jgi:four helix bundle protein
MQRRDHRSPGAGRYDTHRSGFAYDPHRDDRRYSPLNVNPPHTRNSGQSLRKSCVSIPSNIAEGFGRHYTAEYIHHLPFSTGSDNELQTQLELSKRIHIVKRDEAAILITDAEEVGRMLHGLIDSLQRSSR